MPWMFPNGKCISYSCTHLGIIFWNSSMCLSYSFLFTEHSFNSQAGRYSAGDLVTGMRRNGRMSDVRRFFCLLVTFDLLFTSLLWLIVILVCIILVEACNISLPEVNCAIPCATSYIRITFHLFCNSFDNRKVWDWCYHSSMIWLITPLWLLSVYGNDYHRWGKESYFIFTQMRDDSYYKTTPLITHVC